MTDRMKNGECCPYGGYQGLHSPWCKGKQASGPPPHSPEWEQAVAEALGEREVPHIEPQSMEANDEMEFNQPAKVCDMTNVNCTQYFNGKCLHQAAPRRVLGAAKCILIHPITTDVRVQPGCLLQQERSRRNVEKK